METRIQKIHIGGSVSRLQIVKFGKSNAKDLNVNVKIRLAVTNLYDVCCVYLSNDNIKAESNCYVNDPETYERKVVNQQDRNNKNTFPSVSQSMFFCFRKPTYAFSSKFRFYGFRF